MTRKTNIKLVATVTDYGAKREILKKGNKILGWIEQYAFNNANSHEIGKWFFAMGKPSQKDPIQYVCDTADEARNKLFEATNDLGYIGHKHQEDILEDESLSNVPFDNRGDYYG